MLRAVENPPWHHSFESSDETQWRLIPPKTWPLLSLVCLGEPSGSVSPPSASPLPIFLFVSFIILFFFFCSAWAFRAILYLSDHMPEAKNRMTLNQPLNICGPRYRQSSLHEETLALDWCFSFSGSLLCC